MGPAITIVVDGHDIVVDGAVICSRSVLIDSWAAGAGQHHPLSLPDLHLPSIYQPPCRPLQAFLLYLRVLSWGSAALDAFTDAEAAAVAVIANYLISPEIVTLCDRRFTSRPYTVQYGLCEILDFARRHQLTQLYASVLMTKLIDESDHTDLERQYRVTLPDISAALRRFDSQCYCLSLFFKLVKIASQLTLFSDEIRNCVDRDDPDLVIVFADAVRAQAMADWLAITVPHCRRLSDLKLTMQTTRYFRCPDNGPLLQISQLMGEGSMRMLDDVQALSGSRSYQSVCDIIAVLGISDDDDSQAGA